MAYNNNQNEQRESIPQLKLTPAQIAELSALTEREGFQKFAPDEIEMVAELTPEAKYSDFKRYVYRCAQLGLSPIANEIHMEYKYSKGKAKAAHIVHVDAYRKMADRTGQRGGFRQDMKTDERGQYVETVVWRKDAPEPFVSRVYFSEFNNSNNPLYASKMYHLVAKCGEAHAYRQAFPVGDVYSEEDSAIGWGERSETAVQGPVQYNVGEVKPDAPVDAQQKTTAPQQAQADPAPPVQQQPAAVDAKAKLAADWKASMGRLVAMGATKADIEIFSSGYFKEFRVTGKPTPQQTVDALLFAEKFIASNSIEEFLSGIRAQRQPQEPTADPAPPADDISEDPAVRAAMQQVKAKWPMWSRELVSVASLWCADHLKDAAALDAFLITSGVTGTTSPGRIEALLGITRHMSVGEAPAILDYAKRTGAPLSEIEADLSKIVGKDIRHSLEIPKNAVSDAFVKLNLGAKEAKKAA